MKQPVILIVDDDPDIIDGLRRALRKENFQIRSANSGGQALAILRSEPIDLVVSDYEMPGMKGTELLAKVYRIFRIPFGSTQELIFNYRRSGNYG